jgi:5,10-methylenetetrahydromethanopterin reductase
MRNRPSCGVVLQGVDPPEQFEDLVDVVDSCGYDYLWVTDSSLHSRNPYAYLTLAARRSRRLRLGTAVTNPVSRHPGITAVAAATLDDISNGRFILGLGAGDRPVRSLGLRPAPVTQIRATIEAIQHLLLGKTVDVEEPGFRLENARIRFPTRAEVPIFVSASGPKTLAMAGEVADGVILLVGLFRRGIEFALEQIERGASGVGRERPHVALFAYGAIDEDQDAALQAARPIAAWFAETVPFYCDLAGLDGAVVEQIRKDYRGGEFQEATDASDLVPDWFVKQMALAGNREETKASIRAAFDAGIDSLHVFPLGPKRENTIREFAACWREVWS